MFAPTELTPLHLESPEEAVWQRGAPALPQRAPSHEGVMAASVAPRQPSPQSSLPSKALARPLRAYAAVDVEHQSTALRGQYLAAPSSPPKQQILRWAAAATLTAAGLALAMLGAAGAHSASAWAPAATAPLPLSVPRDSSAAAAASSTSRYDAGGAAVGVAMEGGSFHYWNGNGGDGAKGTKSQDATIILTADNGDMVGVSEGAAILALMTDVQVVEGDKGKLFCQSVLHGKLYGQKVMLVTTGIGHDRAALCLRGLLSAYHKVTKEIIFLGTGGFSPAKGGVVDSADCSEPRPVTDATEVVPLGSVCLSSLTTNWDCHKCAWPGQVESACFAAPCSLHGRADLFGDWGCDYYTVTSLADEMLEAARSLELPLPNAGLKAMEEAYWAAMANGTGQPYGGKLASLRPKVFDYTECAETTSNTFWVGTPYDELARDYAADLINSAFASPFFARNPPGRRIPELGVDRSKTVAVSAMEGAGWMEVLALEEVFLKYKTIPAVNVRGAADWVTPPLRRRADKDGTWEELGSFVEDLNGDALTIEGYKLAMQTTGALVTHLFKVRFDKATSSGAL